MASDLINPDLLDLKLEWQDSFERDFKDPQAAFAAFARRASEIKARHQPFREIGALDDLSPIALNYHLYSRSIKVRTEAEDLKEAYESLKPIFKPSDYKTLNYPVDYNPHPVVPSTLTEVYDILRYKSHLDDLLAIKRESLSPPDEYTNPYAEKIPIMSILTLTPDKASWEAQTRAVLEASITHRKSLVAQIMYLNCLRNTKYNEVISRNILLQDVTCEFALAENQHQWVTFISELPAITAETLKRATWCKLLEDEYNKMTREWLFFWTWVEECKAANIEYREKEVVFCTLLKEHCKKKDFLQAKIAESNESVLPAIYGAWAALEWVELDCKTMHLEDDGKMVVRPVFFTRGNEKFAGHCEVVQTLEWE